jgi:hypothetical protein
MGDDDFDLLHVGHYRGMTTDLATGLLDGVTQSHTTQARSFFPGSPRSNTGWPSWRSQLSVAALRSSTERSR